MRADLAAGVVVGAEKPGAIPAVVKNRLFHLVNGFFGQGSLFFQAYAAADFGVFSAVQNKHAGDEDGFRVRAFRGAGGLEGFPGFRGKTVQVQAVVPVGTADERQTVGA